ASTAAPGKAPRFRSRSIARPHACTKSSCDWIGIEMATLTDREYDAELHKLHDQLLLMGAKVEEMIANSMRALTERDSELARRMIEYDHQINRLEIEIDDLCLRILAKRQPVASDLRLITTALKLVT